MHSLMRGTCLQVVILNNYVNKYPISFIVFKWIKFVLGFGKDINNDMAVCFVFILPILYKLNATYG